MLLSTAILSLVSWMGGVMLVAAATGKAMNGATAASFLARLRVPRPRTSVTISLIVEFGTGTAVLVASSRIALSAQAVLFGAFVIVLILYRVQTGERTVSCGCFGSPAPLPLGPHIAVVTVALVGTVGAIATSSRTPEQVMRALPPAESALVVLSVLIAFGLLAGALSVAAGGGSSVVERSGRPWVAAGRN